MTASIAIWRCSVPAAKAVGRALVAAVMLSLSAACAPTRPPPVEYYTLGNAPASEAKPGDGGLRFDLILHVARVEAPEWLKSGDFYYQLAYADAGTLSPYADSRWIASPAMLLEALLREALAASGEWRSVLGPDDNIKADMTLKVRLIEFLQVFSSPRHSNGKIALRATLIDEERARPIAQKDFTVRMQAPSADAAGGASALRAAALELTTAVRQWVVQTAQANAGGGDRPSATAP